MIPTKRSDDIQDFLAFFRQMVGVDKARERAGAPQHEIDRFVNLAKLPLPELYLGYLREFGAQDTVLKLADDGDPRVRSLIHLYEKQTDEVDSEIPAKTVVIATQGLTGGRALLFQSEPTVVVNWWEDIEYTCALTFRNYLYRQAYVRGRFPSPVFYPCLFRTDDELLPQARQFAATELKFQSYWFSDDFQVCMERDDGAALHIERYKDRTTVYLSAVDRLVHNELKNTLVGKLGLKDASAK